MNFLAVAKRSAAIVAARESGRTLKSIGDEYGITRERIRQICVRGTVWREREELWPACSTRLVRVLTGLGFESLQDFSVRHGFTRKSFVTVKGASRRSQAEVERLKVKWRKIAVDTIPKVEPVAPVEPPPRPSVAELLTARRG